MEKEDSFEQAVRCLEDTPRFTRKNSLDHTRHFLSCLGNPERNFDVIHVAGTNGKGSTCAFLEAALRESGYRVGLFTSPHLVSIRERFQIDGSCVDEKRFTQAFRRVKALALEQAALGVSHPTYFEMLFLMGMLLFREAGVEVVVLETGLGGRLDATSSVEHPVLCVITSLSLDHQEYLGDTIEKIAAEKAGILAEGVPVVYDGTDPAAAAVIRHEAERLHCPAECLLPEDVRVFSGGACSDGEKAGSSEKQSLLNDGIRFFLNEPEFSHTCFQIGFCAPYQARNAALAVKALLTLRKRFFRLSRETILEGIARTKWPGRMEWLMPGVLIDGAHNMDGIRQLTGAVARLLREDSSADKSVRLLFSAVSDKDIREMVHILAKTLPLSKVMVTEVGGNRYVPVPVLREMFEKEGILTEAEKDPGRAFFLSLQDRDGEEILLCTGSLYLVGEIKKQLSDLPGNGYL